MKNYSLDFGVVENSNKNFDLVNSFTGEYIPCNESYSMADMYNQRIYSGDTELLKYLRNKYKCIRLQGIYRPLPAIEAKGLNINDVITWNYGYKSQVVEIKQSKSGKSLKVFLKSLDDGIVRERTLRANTLVAVEY